MPCPALTQTYSCAAMRQNMAATVWNFMDSKTPRKSARTKEGMDGAEGPPAERPAPRRAGCRVGCGVAGVERVWRRSAARRSRHNKNSKVRLARINYYHNVHVVYTAIYSSRLSRQTSCNGPLQLNNRRAVQECSKRQSPHSTPNAYANAPACSLVPGGTIFSKMRYAATGSKPILTRKSTAGSSPRRLVMLHTT